jgi:hypothetical protein
MELARLFRTARWLGLLASYLVFGILMPVVTRYQEALFKSVGGGIEITAPKPTPPLAIASFVGNVSQIGLIVTIFIAAGSLAFDARPEWAAFLRTRASVGRIVVPKFAVNAGAAIASFAAGAAAAWIGTALLIDALPVGGMLAGTLYWGVYLAFAVGVVALGAALVRSVIGAAGLTVVVLLAMPLGAEIIGSVKPWMPSTLVGSLTALVDGASAADFLRAATVALLATVACLVSASRLLARREV